MKIKKQLARANRQANELLSLNLFMLFMLMEQQAINNIRSKRQLKEKKVFDLDNWLAEQFSIDIDKLDSLSNKRKQLQLPDTCITHIDNTP